MNFLTKEWKSIVFTVCLIGIVFYMMGLKSQVDMLRQENAKIITTFNSIESVAISADAGINEMSKKVDKIENNVAYIIQKVRRR